VLGLLARVLMQQRNYTQALDSIKIAMEESSKSQDRAVRLETVVAAANVRGGTKQANQAASDLHATLAEAVKYGYVGYQLKARLALAENPVRPTGR
jgi:hypothetical protein